MLEPDGRLRPCAAHAAPLVGRPSLAILAAWPPGRLAAAPANDSRAAPAAAPAPVIVPVRARLGEEAGLSAPYHVS